MLLVAVRDLKKLPSLIFYWTLRNFCAVSCLHLVCYAAVVVVVVVVNGSYSAAPYSSPDRECITKSQLIKVKHRRST